MQARLTTRPEHVVIAAIQALDLESVKQRVMDPELGEGWTPQYADSIEAAYKNYLTMLVKYPDDIEDIQISKDVDEFWHAHILHTRKYAEDCQNVFGSFLHHEPQPRETSLVEIGRRNALAEKTRRLYQQESLRSLYGHTAYCNATVHSGQSAYCNASRREEIAYCNATAAAKTRAYCNATARADNAAYCNATVRARDTAYCNATVHFGMTAYRNAGVRAVDIAYCNAAAEAKPRAYCNATVRARDSAYCNASVNSGKTAYCNAGLQVGVAAARENLAHSTV